MTRSSDDPMTRSPDGPMVRSLPSSPSTISASTPMEVNMDALAGLVGSRRNEDIALDLMRFIAATTGYGKTGVPGAGFQGSADSKAEDYAAHLLELYTRCLNTVNGKK